MSLPPQVGKRHTIAEHIDDVGKVYHSTHSSGNINETTRTIWFTAYERWLNDRPLMIEEDPKAYDWAIR